MDERPFESAWEAHFHLREDWWTQKDKIARRGQAHPVIKEVGPYIQDAIKNLLEAKSILSDPVRKAQYDKKLKDELLKKSEEDLIRFIHFALQGDNQISEEEKANLLNMADTLKVGRDRGEEIILQEMKKAGATFKQESETGSGNTTSSSIPFDILLGQTYYEMLGLPETADYAQIKEVYEREYKKYNTTRDKAKAEARWIPVSRAWECLSDSVKRREYDEKLKEPKTSVPKGVPVLVVNRKSDADYTFKEVRKGTVLSEKILIKNTEGGLLQGTIKTDVPWLEPDRNKVLEKHEQELYIRVLTSKIPAKSYKVDGKVTIDTNGGLPHIIPFTVYLETSIAELNSFKIVFVPITAVIFGLICMPIAGPNLLEVATFTTIPFAIWFAIQRIIEKGIIDNVIRVKYLGVAALIGWIGGWLLSSMFKDSMYANPFATGLLMGAYMFGSLSYLLSKYFFGVFSNKGITLNVYTITSFVTISNSIKIIEIVFQWLRKAIPFFGKLLIAPSKYLKPVFMQSLKNVNRLVLFLYTSAKNVKYVSLVVLFVISAFISVFGVRLFLNKQHIPQRPEPIVAPTSASRPYAAIPAPAPASVPVEAPAPQREMSSINVTKAVIATGLLDNQVPYGVDTNFDSGRSDLYYYVGFNSAIPDNTEFIFKWYKYGNEIRENRITRQYGSENVWNNMYYNFQPGQYEVKLYANGQQLARTLFNVRTSTASNESPTPRERDVPAPNPRSFDPPSQGLRSNGWQKSREAVKYEDD